MDYFENSAPSYRYFMKYLDEYRDQCNFLDFVHNRPRDRIAEECYKPHSDKALLLWGDSHAQQYFHGLVETLPRDVSILQVATSGCSPRLGEIPGPGWLHCNRSNAFALEVARKVRPQIVVLAQSGNHGSTDWQRLATTLKAAGVAHVVLLGPVPHWIRTSTRSSRRILGEHTEADSHTPRQPRHRYRSATQVQILRARERHFMSMIDWLCNSRGCWLFSEETARRGSSRGMANITPTSSEYVARKILTPAFLDLFDRDGICATGAHMKNRSGMMFVPICH